MTTAMQMSFFGDEDRPMRDVNIEHKARVNKAKARKPQIVAEAATQTGGPCARCSAYIPKGDRIFKLYFGPEGGGTTYHGNGPGKWICGNCAARFR